MSHYDFTDRHTSGESQQEKAEARHAEAAVRKGCVCVYPTKNQLQIDIDGFEALGRFHFAHGLLLPGTTYLQAPSPSGTAGRYHITVTLDRELTALERIGLQALLGSDPAREALSYAAALAGVERPTVFFEKKAGE